MGEELTQADVERLEKVNEKLKDKLRRTGLMLNASIEVIVRASEAGGLTRLPEDMTMDQAVEFWRTELRKRIEARRRRRKR